MHMKSGDSNSNGVGWHGGGIGRHAIAGLLLCPAPHLGANKGNASKTIYFIIETHTLLSATKCRVGARVAVCAPGARRSFSPAGVSYEKLAIGDTYPLS